MTLFPLVLAKINVFVMKGVLFFFAAFTIVFGLLFLFSPSAITTMSRWANKVIFPPTDAIPRHGLVGIILLLLGLGMLVVLMRIGGITPSAN